MGNQSGADPGIFDGGGWGIQTLVQKGPLNFFVAHYVSQRRPRVSQSMKAEPSPWIRLMSIFIIVTTRAPVPLLYYFVTH